MNKKVLDTINEQIKHELYSAYLYLAMSAHFEAASMPGFAKWTRLQAEEETEHAMKFFDYVNERGGRVVLQAIDQPPVEFGSPLSVFEEILSHEKKVTSLINNLYAVAVEEKDYATQVMLHWFIEEQVEEESSAQAIVDKLTMAGENKSALMHLDNQVGERG
jgi:ferritin